MRLRWFSDRLSKLDLWPRMALAITLGFLTLFAAFSVLSERALQDSIDKLLEERLAITQLVADQIDNLLADAIFELERANPLFIDQNDELGAAELATLSQTYEQIGLFPDGIVLLDMEGQVVGTQPLGVYPENVDLSELTHIRKVLETGEPTIADPFFHPIDEHPVTAVTVPLTNNGKLIGLLSGFISLDGRGVIMPLNRAAIIGQTEHAVLIDAQGRNLASTFDLPYLSPGEHVTFYQEAMSNGVPVIKTVPFELSLPGEALGHLHVMAFVPLRNAPWGLAVGGDLTGDAFAGIRELRTGMVVIGSISLAAVWIITLLGTKRLVRPVQQLTASAHQIAAGNLSVTLETADGGEIGTMASALNEMRNQLLKNIEELSQWNETLESRVEEQTDHLRQQQQLTQQLLQQVITAQEGERRRIAYELHDEIGQMLTAVQMSLHHLSHGINGDSDVINKRLARSRALTERAVSDLRRIIAALRPTVLDQLGLMAALEWTCDHTLTPLEIQFDFNLTGMEERLPDEIETVLFRIAQESINNISRHSNAKQVQIEIKRSDQEVTMRITDDGKGFEQNGVPDAPGNGHHLGLAGMRERAALAGGKVDISSVSGQGTAVFVIIPLLTLSEEGKIHANPTN